MHLSRFASFGAARPALRASLIGLVAAFAVACLTSPSSARPPLPPLEVKLEPLYERFGKTRVESALYHLATFEGQLRTNVSPRTGITKRRLQL